MVGFLTRWIFAFGLLAATYNPTELNFSRWAVGNWETSLPLTLFLGLVLLVGYIIYLRATLRSIGLFGMLLILAVRKSKKVPAHPAFAGFIGTLAGVTTMIGNLAGPFSNLYFLAMRLPKNEFIGTAAWLYLLQDLAP